MVGETEWTPESDDSDSSDNLDILEALGLEDPNRPAEEMYKGSPVLGHGGKCAMWIELPAVSPSLMMRRSKGETRSLKIATFPSYRPDHSISMDDANRHSNMRWGSKTNVFAPRYDPTICSLITPEPLKLKEVVCMDLDDTRGVVGLATASGELWLIDYS